MAAGRQVGYRIVLRNIGGAALTNVTVSDTLPVSFTYASHAVSVVSATRTATSDPTVGDAVPTWEPGRLTPAARSPLSSWRMWAAMSRRHL
ncbi:MAG: DUF11 domain-containing protein [Caldilineaceae bacterium]